MKSSMTFIVAIALLILLLLYSVTYQVRFDEVAVVTRFGKATENSVRNAGDTDDSGIGLKLPYPIDVVKTFDRRVQILEDRPEEQQTLDGNSIIVQSYLAWRITNPLDFYRSLGSMDEADKQLRSKLRDARKLIGDRYNFADLTNTDPEKLKLPDVENAILDKMRSEMAPTGGQVDGQPLRSYGVELVAVGIKRILLAPKTTQEVFNRMKSTRQRMAEGTRQEGEARAKEIKAAAESQSTTILSFADRRAKNIRAQGDAAAIEFLEVFEQDPELAVFLRKLDFYDKVFTDDGTGRSTFLIDPKTEWLFSEFATPTLRNTATAGAVDTSEK